MTGAARGTGTTYHSGSSGFTCVSWIWLYIFHLSKAQWCIVQCCFIVFVFEDRNNLL